MGVHYGYFSPLRDATLYRDFTKYQNINHGIGPNILSFTRSSVATFYNKNGILEQASADNPRFNYTQGVLDGLLIEGSKTNFIRQSQDIAAGFWIKENSIEVANLLGDNLRISPDNTTYANFVRFPSNTLARTYQLISLPTAANQLTFSVWLKSATGVSQQIKITLKESGTGVEYNSLIATVTAQWQRFSISADCSSNASGVIAGIDHDLLTYPEWNILIWGGQLEIGTFASSYIPTTNETATRAIDAVDLINSQTFLQIYNQNEGTIFIEWKFINGNNTPSMFEAYFGQEQTSIRQDFNSDRRRYATRTLNGNLISVLGRNTSETISSNDILKCAFAYKDKDSTFVRGSTIFTDNTTSYPLNLTSLSIGRSPSQNNSNSFAFLRKIAYIPYKIKNIDLLRICQ